MREYQVINPDGEIEKVFSNFQSADDYIWNSTYEKYIPPGCSACKSSWIDTKTGETCYNNGYKIRRTK